jgi:hypothetical protein
MSVANTLKTPVVAPAIADQFAGSSFDETVLYNVTTLAARTGVDSFTPLENGYYMLQLTMLYDQTFGAPSAGAYTEITMNGLSVLFVPGTSIILPATAGVDRAATVNTMLFELGAGVQFNFDTIINGWNTPSGCTATLTLYGPF